MHLESLNRIKSYVDSLPESLRTAFTLREVDGKSYEEIAETMGMSISAIKSLLSRARENLRKNLARSIK